MCGAIWAEAAWGRYWGWDPKETWSFVAWVVYACYLHARSTPSVSRRITSWIAVAGWVAMLINLYGVNIFASSFHSYSGLK
jgi:ABC-type transport system involved in cytochrome c biogenesis permease subunit